MLTATLGQKARKGLVKVRHLLRILGLSLLVGAFSLPAFSQQVTGSILGSVQDAQGAVVVGAQVAARNNDTGFARTAVSNERGEYRIDFLPPGTYELQVSSTGFRSFINRGIA